MKLPRSFKAWLVALVSLAAVAFLSIAPMTRPLAQSSTTYTFTDLGTLGGTYSRAFGINNCGQVVGESSVTGASPRRPFLWRDSNNNGVSDSGEMKDLGTLGGNSGAATDINLSGLVTGTASNGVSNRAFRWQDVNANGQSDPGEMNDLSSSAGDFFGFGVNSADKIVGGIEDSNLAATAFIWSSGTGLQLLPGPTPYIAYAINGSGQVVGYNGANDQAFVLTGTTYTYLPTFGGSRSIAYDINDTGHVVGMAYLSGAASPPQHAFKWDGSSLQDLGVLAGGIRSTGFGINSAGVVVGFSEVTGGAPHAFVHDGTLRDLNTAGVVTNLPVGWVLQQADKINDSGQIVGYGTNGSGDLHAFLLTPTGVTPPSCPLASPNVNVSVSPSAVNEDAVGSLTYTFTRSIVTASPLTVNFSTGGTAVANDYAMSAVSNVQIPANSASVNVTVTPIADTTDEPNETVVLTVTTGANYNVGAQNVATGTITDDDGTPTIQITSVTAPEPSSGSTSFVFTVSLTNPSSSQITVNYATDTTGAASPATGGAGCTAGVDFVSISGGLTFLTGETSKQVSVTVCSDSNLEPDETFFVNLSGNTNSDLPAGTKGTGTITPQAPVVFTEEGNTSFAVAIDSVTFVRGPFRLTNEWNFTPSDRATRIILITSNLGMTQPDLATGILSVNVAGYANPLPIENVGPITNVPGLNASFIIVRLPADLPNPSPGPNNLTLTVKMGSASSNATLISITP